MNWRLLIGASGAAYALYYFLKPSHASAMVPTTLFGSSSSLDRAVRAAKPQLFLKKSKTLVVAFPGAGDSTANFLKTMVNGLGTTTAVAVIGSTKTATVDHFISKICASIGATKVYLAGFSNGGLAASSLASKLKPKTYRVVGAASMAAGSWAPTSGLKGKRVMFAVAPPLKSGEKPYRSDQANRRSAAAAHKRLKAAGIETHLLYIPSVKQHQNWHWGVLSPCPYPKKRSNKGKGFRPNYAVPNKQTLGAVATFVKGGTPRVSNVTQTCA